MRKRRGGQREVGWLRGCSGPARGMTGSAGAHRDVVLVGGRCIGRTLLERLEENRDWHVVCVIDDGLKASTLLGKPVCGFEDYSYDCRTAILALGNPADKRFYRKKALSIGLTFATYIDPMALVASSCRIGAGSVVMPFASVVDGTEIGEHVFLSLYSGAGKNARVGDYSTLTNYSSVRAAILGVDVTLASAAHVLEGANVGDGCWLAPGTILRRPVGPGQLVWGNSAHRRRRSTAERSSGSPTE